MIEYNTHSIIRWLNANNYAFIDSQDFNLAIRDQGWKLDFARFKEYLKAKHGVIKCFLFIGYVPDNQRMYTSLQKTGICNYL